MDSAFVLVVAKRPGIDVRPRVRLPGLVTGGRASDLGFDARHRLDHHGTGGLALVVWHSEASRDGGSWHEDPRGVFFVTGHLFCRGRDWRPSSEWASELARASEQRSVSDLQGDLRGVFVAGHISGAGDGWLIPDALGLRCLYWGEDADVLVVSSRATLAALALSPDALPERDTEPAAWLAYTGHHFGVHTGYRDVGVVPVGGWLRLAAGAPTWERTDPFTVAPDDELRTLSVGDLAEIVQHDVADSLRAALSHPAEGHIIRLTGGKDSRLLLAVAVRAGLARDFTYETAGHAGLADVQIAVALCERLRLQHTTNDLLFLGVVARDEPFDTRFRRYVEQTAGIANGRDLRSPAEMPPALRLTGLVGEPLRGYERLGDDELTGSMHQGLKPYGRLGLLRPHVLDGVEDALRDALATQPSPTAHPGDRIVSLYAAGRTRYARLGPREEIGGIRRCHPLYSRTTLRVAMAMDPTDRAAEILHAEVMRRASSMLVEHRFAGSGWNDRARAHLTAANARPGRPPSDRDGSSAGPPAPERNPRHASDPAPLMASVYAAESGDRTRLLTELLADAANPAWQVLDRAVARRALGRYATLSNRERKELFGAATAAAWLEGGSR